MNLTMSNEKIISFISMLEYECKIYSLYENFLFENKMKEFAEMKRRKKVTHISTHYVVRGKILDTVIARFCFVLLKNV